MSLFYSLLWHETSSPLKSIIITIIDNLLKITIDRFRIKTFFPEFAPEKKYTFSNPASVFNFANQDIYNSVLGSKTFFFFFMCMTMSELQLQHFITFLSQRSYYRYLYMDFHIHSIDANKKINLKKKFYHRIDAHHFFFFVRFTLKLKMKPYT